MDWRLKIDWRLKTAAVAMFSLGFVLVAGGPAEAAGVEWRTNLKKAAQESKKTQKPMLIKISAAWCGPCQRMKESYNSPEVAKHVNANFIPIAVDADRNQKLVDAIGVEFLPTSVILTSEYEVVKKIRGFLPPKKLNSQLKETDLSETTIAQTAGKEDSADSNIEPVSHAFAFEQICLVSLKDSHKLISGDESISITYRNKQICFASENEKQLFEAAPEKYWPALNGVCAVTLSESKKIIEGQPKFGAVYKGELWFFDTVEARAKFKAAPKKFAQP